VFFVAHGSVTAAIAVGVLVSLVDAVVLVQLFLRSSRLPSAKVGAFAETGKQSRLRIGLFVSWTRMPSRCRGGSTRALRPAARNAR
jgi:hypothetical protein